ncbi:tissue factor [Hemicordylus capensis]|uniref:tissue factor n=1 Tax=Hemicordylus capensis TaxID=884348 RepID=UPI002303F466|nr:tissue factor [Hemicordylus capensis]
MAITTRYFLAAAVTCSRALLLCALFSLVRPSSGNSKVLTATNITWSSINFKTLLRWEPEPTDYSYTVEIDGEGLDRKKTCVDITKTECDVTKVLKNVKDTYTARIYSVMRHREDDYDTPPYELSPKFTPYSQTEIGIPTVEYFEQNNGILRVVVKDPLTPYRFNNGSFQSIRDIFVDDLEYTLNYWKDQSTGKKTATTKSNQFEIKIDRGENYCFYVQAVIPSRSLNRTSQESMVSCTSKKRDELDALGLDAILIIAGSTVGILILIIILSVIIYKCTKSKHAIKEKEHVPLNI